MIQLYHYRPLVAITTYMVRSGISY